MDVFKQIEKLLPYYYHKRFRFYFDRYGCVRCERKDVIYGCSGLCLHCLGLVSDRLKRSDQIMAKRYKKVSAGLSKSFLKRRESAREILADVQNVVHKFPSTS